MAVVKGDLGADIASSGDGVEKILPLAVAVPLAMAAWGAKEGSGYDFTRRDDEGRLVWDPGFHSQAKLQDPLTGGMLYEDELGTSGASRLTGGLVGATQGLNPLNWLKPLSAAGKGMKAARAARAARLSDEAAAGAQAARARAAEEMVPTGTMMDLYGGTSRYTPQQLAMIESRAAKDIAAQQAGRYQRVNPLHELDVAIDATPGARAMALGRQGAWAGTEGALRGAGYVAAHPGMRQAARLGQVGTSVGPLAVAGLAGAMNPQMTASLLGLGAGGTGTGGADVGMAQSGAGGVGGVAGYRHGVNPEQAIWSGQLEQQRAVRTGEDMNIGEQMLKEAKEGMGKKPKGGGMILIIGHGGGKKPQKDDDDDSSPCPSE